MRFRVTVSMRNVLERLQEIGPMSRLPSETWSVIVWADKTDVQRIAEIPGVMNVEPEDEPCRMDYPC